MRHYTDQIKFDRVLETGKMSLELNCKLYTMHRLVLHTLPLMHLPLCKQRSNYLQEYTLIAKSCHKHQVCKHLNSQSTNWKWLMTIAFWELKWVDIISRFSKQNIFETKSLKRRDNSCRI